MTAPTFSQEIVLTVVPNGMSVLALEGPAHTYLDFSLVLSPRLKSDHVDPTTLASYPDWAVSDIANSRTWPDTVDAVFSSMRLNVIGLPDPPYGLIFPSGPLSPDDSRFPQVFPAATPVTPYATKDLSNRKIRSAPVAAAVGVLHDVYGRFGFQSPTTFPPYSEIVGVNAFGPMGFQQTNHSGELGHGESGIPGHGVLHKQTLVDAIEAKLAQSGHQALSDADLAAIATASGIPGALISLVFLQHQQFLQRDLPRKSPRTFAATEPPAWDFHQMVAALGSLPSLLRYMGIVVDFRAGPLSTNALNTLANAGAAGVEMTVELSLDTSQFLLPTTVITPATLAVGTQSLVFRAIPKPGAQTDHANRMLKIGNPNLYEVIRLDHDSAAIKTLQFGNNVTRSRIGAKKQTPSTPDNYALPALRTGGFAVARSERAVQMAATLKRQTDDLFNGGSQPLIYEDDLIRGYRFDVLDVKDGVWHSLMWRKGTVSINGSDPIDVTEEDTIVPAPTSQQKDPQNPDPAPDLYLQETLSRWDGWSLAVPRIGKQFRSNVPATPADSGSSGIPAGINVVTEWHVPGQISDGTDETSAGNALRLPRLRFGRSYQLRARVGDIAGNALPVGKAPKSGVAVSPELKHLRFEPLPAPRVVLQQSNFWAAGNALRPGDSEEVIVVRSESATVDSKTTLDNSTSSRLALPGRSSVFLAEQHGAFDAATAGHAMKSNVFQDIADRDATSMFKGAQLLGGGDDPTQNTTQNPWLYPNFFAISYLADVATPSALVRNLPINAFKKTTAELPWDTAHRGWPRFQSVILKLSRGASNTWTTKVVPNLTDPARTTELDVTLGKGYEFTTLVNSGIDPVTLGKMAIWEWILDYAAKHNQSATDVRQQILNGEHWMFTPWREVKFVHAVRTPLKNPVLMFEPNKSAIGQTYALFHGTQANPKAGTITFSRRSTARVDVEATWFMPVDDPTTTNDPETPQKFTAHAFSIEPARDGGGFTVDSGGHVIGPVTDAENLNLKHEFHDTKYRAVTYDGTATSFYPEYFRESKDLDFGGNDPITTLKDGPFQPGVAFEGSTVRVTISGFDGDLPRTLTLTPAPLGTDPAADPPPGDYIVTEDIHLNGPNPDAATHGTIQMLTNSTAGSGWTAVSVEFSYVGPTIHTFSNHTADKTVKMHVLNSARPKVPDVLYVIPIYKRTPSATGVTRTGGGLRVYLNRTWWSSGDEERLGVLCWHKKPGDGPLPDNSFSQYVTQWGFDPIFKSAAVPAQPVPSNFPWATKSSGNGSLTLEESTVHVDVAGHDVHFDSDRKLWYCDIRVTDTQGNSLTSYTPFIRFALARYQPFSIPDTHLSRVVTVDYAQLAPDRHLTVSTVRGGGRAITITGRSPRATWQASSVNQHVHQAVNKIVVILEAKDPSVKDDNLAWGPVTDHLGQPIAVTMDAATSGTSDEVTWTKTIQLPTNPNGLSRRFAFEEYERIEGGTGGGRLAYTETIPI